MNRTSKWIVWGLLLAICSCTTEPTNVAEQRRACTMDLDSLHALCVQRLAWAREIPQPTEQQVIDTLLPLVADPACTTRQVAVEVWKMIGDKYFALKNANSSLRAYQSGLDLYKRLPPTMDSTARALEGELLHACANRFAQIGSQDSAINFAKKAIHAKQSQYGIASLEVAKSFGALAQAYQNNRAYDEAIKLRRQVLAIRQSSARSTPREMAYAWFNLGDGLLDTPPCDSVAYCMAQTIKFIPALKHDDSLLFLFSVDEAMARLGRLQNNSQDAQKAIGKWLARAKAMGMPNPDIAAKLYETKGNIEREIGDFDTALQSYHEALLLRLPASTRPNLHDLPPVDSLGTDPNVFVALALKARAIIGHPDTAVSNHFVATAERAFQLLDGLRRGFWAGDVKADISAQAITEYEFAMRMAISRNMRAQAFAWLERSKENELLDIVQDLTRLNLDVIPKDTLDMGKRFLELSKANLAFRDSLTALQAAVRRAYPGQLRAEPTFAAIQDVRQQLGDTAMFVSYYWGAQYLIASGVTTRRDTLLALPITPALRASIARYRHDLQSRWTKDTVFAASAYEVYTAILQPLFLAITEGRIPKRLILSPHGELSTIPFEALTTDPKPRSFRKLPYLLQQTVISYVQSGTMYAAYRPETVNGGVLGIGSTGGFRNLGTIMHVKDEIDAVIDHMGGEALLNATHAEHSIKNEPHLRTMLHIASHGLFEPTAPLLSRLQLADDSTSGEDGDLYAHEVMRLHLPEKMAVLSACQSGPGTTLRGQEMTGMGYAFQVAQCSTVVMSLWSVDDMATYDIMDRFYAHIADGLPVANALTQARRDYLSDPHSEAMKPLMWAPWVMAGNGELRFVATPSRAWILWLALTALLLLLSAVAGRWWRRRRQRQFQWT